MILPANHKLVAIRCAQAYTNGMSHKNPNAQKVSIRPTRMSLVVSALAVVSLVLFTLMAIS